MTDPQHEETFADTERKLREIITTLRAQLAEAREVSEADKIAIRNKALREAADACTYVIKNIDILKSDGETYETPRVQKIARGLVDVASQEILALIEKEETK